MTSQLQHMTSQPHHRKEANVEARAATISRGVHENIASASFQNMQYLVYLAKSKIRNLNEVLIIDSFIPLPNYKVF